MQQYAITRDGISVTVDVPSGTSDHLVREALSYAAHNYSTRPVDCEHPHVEQVGDERDSVGPVGKCLVCGIRVRTPRADENPPTASGNRAGWLPLVDESTVRS